MRPIRQALRQGARYSNSCSSSSSLNSNTRTANHRIRCIHKSSTTNTTRTTNNHIPKATTTNNTTLANYRINNSYTRYQTIRTALAVEASGLRYVHYVLGSGSEDSLPRGWDDDLIQEDEDGT